MPAEQKQRTQRRKDKDPNTDLENLALEMGNKPPQAIDVEAAVLGAMLLEPSCVDIAMEELTPDCFYDHRHRLIFSAMSALIAANQGTSIDIITVSAKLREKGDLEAVGGPVVLANLSEQVGSAAHIEYYVRILKQKAIQRNLITASYAVLKDAYDESVVVDELIDKAQTRIYDAVSPNLRKEVQDIGSVIFEAMNELTKIQDNTGFTGVPSGFKSIDNVTQGWQKSDLIILAARPSVGKTAFSLNLARNAAVDFHMPVAFFSLEMSSIQLAKRLMTSESGLSAEKIKGGKKLELYEWKQLESKISALSEAPLYIDDTPGIQLNEFRTKAKNLVKNKGVRLIFVDYLQLMQGPTELRGIREQEVAAISRTLKATAKELDVPIIALSQLSRQAVQRQGSGGKPVLSDLRESGSIEQDADMVMFIYREDYYNRDTERKNISEIIIGKQRNGPVGTVELAWLPQYTMFRNLEKNRRDQQE